METLLNPFRTQMNQLGQQVLEAQKQAADWQLGQMKMAEKQVISAMELSRAGFEANLSAARTMSKTWLDAVAPAEAPKA